MRPQNMRRHSSHLELKGFDFSFLMDIISTANPLENSQNNFQRNSLNKIPSEMEVAPRYNCFYTVDTVDCWHCWLLTLLIADTVDMVYTVDITYDEQSFDSCLSCSNFPMGKTSWGLKCPLESDCHTSVQEYFLIHCHTRVSRSIF